MAKYYLTINGRPNIMNEVSWASLEFKDFKPNALEDIDKFCMSFDDELGIKNHLKKVAINDYNNGIINQIPELKNQLNIRYRVKKDGPIFSLSYGLPFKKDKKYFDYYYLKARLQSLKTDPTFLSRLAASFSGGPVQASNIATFQRSAISLKSGGFYDTKELDKALEAFIRIELLKYDKATYSHKTDKDGTLLVQYRKLHDLAMFIKNYVDKQEEIITPTTPIITPTKDTAPLKKVLTPEYEQITLFIL